MTEQTTPDGTIVRISGPVVSAQGLTQIRLHDVVYVGRERLIGEVIRLSGENCVIQVHEDTSGVEIGEPVWASGFPLVVELGPGLVNQVFDGLQRPLYALEKCDGAFLERGTAITPLSRTARWRFEPCREPGDEVVSGSLLGRVRESGTVEHRVMVPPGRQGRLKEIYSGEFTVTEPIALLETPDGKIEELTMMQRWPVREPRPVRQRIDPHEPLLTGTRIIDLFFPVAKGGSAIIPGGFGTGKTATMQSLARWSDVDIVIYVGCGERGNEMAMVLEEFPHLEDPRSGENLMNRTVLIANTSNMPVAAREASIYTGMTIAEYYRDMGYDVLILADSTSRWGEALREISGRLEEIPGEEGYPAYLASRISGFYERTGRAKVPCDAAEGERIGSISLIGAVSPPGGDFSEPITQSSMRVAGSFWALDYELSRQRHFPAINWIQSYSLYDFVDWYANKISEDWPRLIQEAMSLLSSEEELLQIVQLVGKDALSENQQEILALARMLREDLLQQSALDPVDRFSPLEKSFWMLKLILEFHTHTQEALASGTPLNQVMQLPLVESIGRMKSVPIDEAVSYLRNLLSELHEDFSELGIRIEEL